MARITKSSTNRTVKTVANHGQQYAVVFDETGEIISVSVLFRRGCDYRTQSREIWHRRQGRPMSITAACAGRAAIADLAKSAENMFAMKTPS